MKLSSDASVAYEVICRWNKIKYSEHILNMLFYWLTSMSIHNARGCSQLFLRNRQLVQVINNWESSVRHAGECSYPILFDFMCLWRDKKESKKTQLCCLEHFPFISEMHSIWLGVFRVKMITSIDSITCLWPVCYLQ